MRMKRAAVLGALFLAAVLAVSSTSVTQESAGVYQSGPPFVGLSLIGSEVVFSPDRLRYSVTADPGTFVTVFLISPSGRRSVLNPYERATGGLERQVFVRQTLVGYETGESYLVAMVTRSAFHRSSLVRQAQSEGRMARTNMGADASLSDLLTGIMPIFGDDISATYVSFRVISRGLAQPYGYAAGCHGSALIFGSAFFDDGFYVGRSRDGARYDAFGYEDPLLYSLNQSYLSAGCRDRLFDKAMIIARGETGPVPPIAHHDSGAVAVDSGRRPVTPAVPRGHPVDPDAPGITQPALPTPIGVGPSSHTALPMSVPVRVDPVIERPVTPESPLTVERADPVSPVLTPTPRVHPVEPMVERERQQPISEPTMRVEPPQVPPPTMTPPPPRVSPTPEPSPVTPTPAPPPGD